MNGAQQKYKAQVIDEVASMSSRAEVISRMDAEPNAAVRAWIGQYLQTLYWL